MDDTDPTADSTKCTCPETPKHWPHPAHTVACDAQRIGPDSGFAAGGPIGPIPPGGLIPPSLGCSGGINERALRASGHGGQDFLARLNAGEPIPLRGQPKTEEFAAAVAERMAAEHQQQEAALRTALVAKVYTALDDAVANPANECGDASGHLGHNGFQAMAEAAVDVFVDSARGGITLAQIAGAPTVTPSSVIINGIEYVPKTTADGEVIRYPYNDFPPTPGPGWAALNAMQEKP